MKSIHIIFTILSCSCFFVNSSNSVGQSGRQPTVWESPITTTTTTQPPLESQQRTRQTRRSQKMLYNNNGNTNDANLKFPNLANQTDGGDDLEKGDSHAKEFDHKHRVLLAVESDLKYRDRTKKQEKVKNSPSQNDTLDSRKRLKDGLKILFSKLNPPQSTTDSILQKSQPVNEAVSRPQKSRKLSTNKPRKPISRTYLRTLKCEDVPHLETLLHSGLFTDATNSKDTQSQNPMIGQPADATKDLYELRRQLMMKQRRNPLKFFPTYHNYQPFAWPTTPNAYNRYNYNNPYNNPFFDCNYFLDTVNQYDYPTVQYVWDDYDYDVDRNRMDARTLDILKGNVRARE